MHFASEQWNIPSYIEVCAYNHSAKDSSRAQGKQTINHINHVKERHQQRETGKEKHAC